MCICVCFKEEWERVLGRGMSDRVSYRADTMAGDFHLKCKTYLWYKVVFRKSKIFILFFICVFVCVCVLCQNRSNVETENTKVPCGVCGGRPFFIITYYMFAHQNISPIPCFFKDVLQQSNI